MSRKASGTVFREAGRWKVRYTLPSGRRPVSILPDTIGENDRALAELIGKAVSDAARNAVLPEPEQTFRAWSTHWIADRTRRGQNSAFETESRLNTYIFPHIGDLPMREINRQHIAAIVRTIDDKIVAREIAWKTGSVIWATLTSAFKDAVSSKDDLVRVLTSNPTTDVRGPETGEERSKQWLLPSEYAKLVDCDAVPLRWKRLVTVAIYTAMRAAELQALDVADVHLEAGYIHIHRTVERHGSRGKVGSLKTPKSGKSRKIPIDPALKPLLEKMVAECVATGRTRLLKMPGASTAALMLRRFLKKAGVTRAELFETTTLTKRLTFHDLRASGLTWMAIAGVDPLKLQSRAGHSSLNTTAIYIREVESLDKSALNVFPKLGAPLI